ncbi:MAG: DNA mismatch repair endonuclease MutL [Lachnospiraceae bacterium]|nr:DNA mismatch repair endonuclease MutL [Lachnospiraceae bacterium]
MIKVLDQATVNKIAAGEVVERPSSVVKELVENAIDAGATAITVEIKDGGTSLIRITDNGAGIEKEEVPTAFVRHATSKIITIEDLLSVSSLGFRGEALASIAAVSQVECITKTAHALTGIRYEIHGSREISSEEIGAPTGTTIIVRNLFYNVPARKKFLKTPMTEGSYVTELVTRLSLSHPEVSFKYIINGSNKIATSGNGRLKDVIYHIYGKDISANLLPVKRTANDFAVEGYVGKAYVSKGNRSFEHYFVNGRYIRSNIVTKAIEEAYKSFVMVHKFPFTALHFTLDSNKLDVNVHPTKMEFKYADGEQLFDFVKDSVRQALLSQEMIQDVSLRTAKEERELVIEQQRKSTLHVPEPFEKEARALRYQQAVTEHKKEQEDTKSPVPGDTSPDSTEIKKSAATSKNITKTNIAASPSQTNKQEFTEAVKFTNIQEIPAASVQTNGQASAEISDSILKQETAPKTDITDIKPIEKSSGVDTHTQNMTSDHVASVKGEQISMDMESFISGEARKKHRLIGQVFKTYWMIEYENKLYIVDQHAAHEKVMFERLMRQLADRKVLSQQLLPPKVLHLDSVEHTTVMSHMDLFAQTGFDIEDFGDDSVVVRAMPDDIMGVAPQALFDALLNALTEDIGKISIDFFVEKLSGMACKAAIKGNTEITTMEADTLIDEMLSLDNPYNCPHGRPTMIALTKTELERKFKRIQN